MPLPIDRTIQKPTLFIGWGARPDALCLRLSCTAHQSDATFLVQIRDEQTHEWHPPARRTLAIGDTATFPVTAEHHISLTLRDVRGTRASLSIAAPHWIHIQRGENFRKEDAA